MVVREGAIVHDRNRAIGPGGVSASRGTARGRSLIGDSKDRARGKGGLERWGVSRDNIELEIDGIGRIPPLWLKSSLIGTGGKINIMPDVYAGVAGARGIEVYVSVACGQTRRIPGDIDGCRVLKRLRGRRGFVEAASAAS
jgi:hypothetical protein